MKNKIKSGDPFYWCIATVQQDSPKTGEYYSTLQKCYFINDLPEINLNSYNKKYLNSGDEVMYTFTASESGNYVFSSIGSTDVNITIYDDKDIKDNYLVDRKVDNDNNGTNVNFNYTKYIEAGTKVYVKIGSSKKSSGWTNFMVTNCYIAEDLNKSYSTTISGKNEVWYKFTAQKDGDYTFYTTGNIDVFGELFLNPTSKGSTTGRILYDDYYGFEENFAITYKLTKGKTVYIRIKGYSESVKGTCNFYVSYTPVIKNLSTSYSDVIYKNGYTVYKFTATTSGKYTFYTTGNTDTYMNLFNVPVTDRTTTTGSIAYNNDGGKNYNASISYYLSKNKTIYIRVRGNKTFTNGNYNFVVEYK